MPVLRRFLPNFQKSVRKFASDSTDLKGIIGSKIEKERANILKFRKEHGKTKVSEVTVNAIYGGMRGVLGMVTETSLLDPAEGIRFRGLSIPECKAQLPKAPGSEEALPEGMFWLLVTGDVPSQTQVNWLSKEWAQRSDLPDYIIKMLNNLPKDIHPMSQLSACLTLLNRESKFLAAYNKGTAKGKLWESAYEDSMELLGKIAPIAALIYRNSYKDRKPAATVDKSKDWSYNYAKIMGFDDPKFIDLIRLYLLLHCDHEGGNVSAHTCHLVGSALSDPYLSWAAGLNGLAGPLHGLANQEVLVWLEKLRKELGDSVTDEQLKGYIWKTLKAGQVIPGYGHAVLRKTDPRYTCQMEFAMKYLPNDPVFKIVKQLYKVVPPILTELGKVQNPWPNVDAHSGVLLQYFGMKEMQYYTVMFGVSRAIGVLASLVWDRGLGLPIERPKTITTEALKKKVGAS